MIYRWLSVSSLLPTKDLLQSIVEANILSSSEKLPLVPVQHSTSFYPLPKNFSHAATTSKGVALPYGSVCFAEIWCQEDVEDATSQTFNGIRNRKNSNALSLRLLILVARKRVAMLKYLMSVHG